MYKKILWHWEKDVTERSPFGKILLSLMSHCAEWIICGILLCKMNYLKKRYEEKTDKKSRFECIEMSMRFWKNRRAIIFSMVKKEFEENGTEGNFWGVEVRNSKLAVFFRFDKYC